MTKKTMKGGKVMNPTDAYRKELRKKELKRNKKERKKVRILKKDPNAIKEQIQKLETMKAESALDKARKHKWGSEDVSAAQLPPPPPPPPLPNTNTLNADGSVGPLSLPLPPPPPMPPTVSVVSSGLPLPSPPGPPPQDQAAIRPPPYLQEDDPTYRSISLARQKPSYVKSAASTVVKRPLAQHQPELTSMVPASVRVSRETTAPKGKPKPMISTMTTTAAPIIIKPESTTSSAAPKPQSIDDSYVAFLEDMKVLGALEG